MRNNVVRLLFTVVTLVFGLALEEMLPKVFYVGFPVLLGATVFFASRRSVTIAVFLAFTAGFAEDAVSGLPFFTSASYFLLVAMSVKVSHLPYVVAPIMYPLYQLWISMWTVDLNGSVFTRFLVAFPVGTATAALTAALLDHLYGKVGFDEEA